MIRSCDLVMIVIALVVGLAAGVSVAAAGLLILAAKRGRDNPPR